MKKLFFRHFIFLFLVLSSLISSGQTYFVYAKSSEGKNFGRYRMKDMSVSSVLDTISVMDARKIVAVNAVRGSKLVGEQGNIQVQSFNLTIEVENASSTYMSNDSLLTPQMRKQTMNISSGAVLYFKDIKMKSHDSPDEIPLQSIAYLVL